jgi:integrase
MSGRDRRPVRSLPVERWPQADRLAWQAACHPGKRLRRGGAAAHMKAITRADLARRYGYFIDCLDRTGRLTPSADAAALVSPEAVGAYVEELTSRVRSTTVYGSVYKLRRAAEVMAPERDFTWLKAIEADLALQVEPRSKYPKLVLTDALLAAGLALLDAADREAGDETQAGDPDRRRRRRKRRPGAIDRALLTRAVQARSGLMLALLALCPIRLKNFAALELGRSLVQTESGTWFIVLAASETKEKRPDERPVPEMLAAHLNRYLSFWRPLLARGRFKPVEGPLWVQSQHGRAMPYSSVEAAIRRSTERAFGVQLGAHMFRVAASTTAAVRAPGTPHLGSALLHHIDPRTTEQHYNRASAHQAARTYADIINGYREPGRSSPGDDAPEVMGAGEAGAHSLAQARAPNNRSLREDERGPCVVRRGAA